MLEEKKLRAFAVGLAVHIIGDFHRALGWMLSSPRVTRPRSCSKVTQSRVADPGVKPKAHS